MNIKKVIVPKKDSETNKKHTLFHLLSNFYYLNETIAKFQDSECKFICIAFEKSGSSENRYFEILVPLFNSKGH